MHHTYVTGWIADVRKRVRFIPADAIITTCSDPQVLVFNRHGNFFIPHLEAGRTYEFIVRNGTTTKRWRITPKQGHNEAEIEVRTKPVRIPATPKPDRPSKQVQA